MKIYVKLRNGKWMLINRKLEYTVTLSKRRSRVSRYILAGEHVEKPPVLNQAKTTLVPATIVSKLVSKLLDVKSDGVVLLEQHSREHFVVKADEVAIGIVENALQELLASKKHGRLKTTEE